MGKCRYLEIPFTDTMCKDIEWIGSHGTDAQKIMTFRFYIILIYELDDTSNKDKLLYVNELTNILFYHHD